MTILFALKIASFAQKGKGEEKDKSMSKVSVPTAVKTALAKKYPAAAKITWEKEKRNYEASRGGRPGEDNSVQFTPVGEFIEIIKAMPVSELPAPVTAYIKGHCKAQKSPGPEE